VFLIGKRIGSPVNWLLCSSILLTGPLVRKVQGSNEMHKHYKFIQEISLSLSPPLAPLSPSSNKKV
jgi:hypothetical protein